MSDDDAETQGQTCSEIYPGPVGWPWPLCKALDDEFFYSVGLRDGTVIKFTSARCDDTYEWVTLLGIPVDEKGEPCDEGYMPIGYRDINAPCPRGIVVRVADIVWAVDAPDGS